MAITLLVLNIDVPDVSEGELRDALIDLLPSIYIYVLSFAVIGRFWVIHHNLFETLVRFDGMLMFLNLVFLLFVALLPFATDLLGEYPDSGLATASFSVSVALASLAHWAMSTYSVRRGFVHERHVTSYSGEAFDQRPGDRRHLHRRRAPGLRGDRDPPRAVDRHLPGALSAAQAGHLSLAVDRGHLPGHVRPVEREHVLLRLGHQAVAQLHVGEQPLGHRGQRVRIA